MPDLSIYLNKIHDFLDEICVQGQNELAYLAMTGKIENCIRDKLAFRLLMNHPESFFVARDWSLVKSGKENTVEDEMDCEEEKTGRRVDIVVFDAKTKRPDLTIELKATNTDSSKSGKLEHINRHIRKLVSQLADIGLEGTPVLGILLAVHPADKIPEDISVKYHKNINRDRASLKMEYDDFIKKGFLQESWKILGNMAEYSLGNYRACNIELLVHFISR